MGDQKIDVRWKIDYLLLLQRLSILARRRVSWPVAVGLQPSVEVITTLLTFCATINTIIHAGATPVLADVDADSLNIDTAQVKAKVTAYTLAILPVHFAWRSFKMKKLMVIRKMIGLPK